ncbi:hypothetical protein LPUS_00861 [Lasallia pustulata]|uniref:Uncharacterized protein n=1 Tax=Lasallia pustulata TaxID=136370 RepID=A0A1W5D4E4_9LECA|nr:hypothetical protein LPUS_00861 [Lasallia pustulata]
MVSHSHDVRTRIQALSLVEYGDPTKLVVELTGLSIHSINRLKTARERGYEPEKSKLLLTEYVADVPRSGCSKMITLEKGKALLDVRVDLEQIIGA